jgi:hypothetical protein
LDPACPIEHFLAPARTQTGELALAHFCQGDGPSQDLRMIVIAELDTGQHRPVSAAVRTPDQITLTESHAGAFSTGTLICQGIIRVAPPRNEPFNVAVDGDGKSFNLADEFDPPGDCTETGRADFPAFRPDSTEMAFFASPGSVGVSGEARLAESWGLYETSGSGTASLLLSPISEPRGLAWSFDGRWLFFGGSVNGASGVWAFHPDTATLMQLWGESVDWLASAPSAYALAAITNDGDGAGRPQRRLVRIDISELPALPDSP